MPRLLPPRARLALHRLRRGAEARDYYTGWHDPSRITMGRGSYGNPRLVVYAEDSGGRVSVGAFCSIAAGVRFLVDGAHRHDFITSSPIPDLTDAMPPGHARSRGPITVGNDVWIGRDATILSGVTIGTGAVIGACSVVFNDVRPYAVVVGNPAQEVRRRFSDEQCDALLATRWWEWPDRRIIDSLPLLWSADVAAFLAGTRSAA